MLATLALLLALPTADAADVMVVPSAPLDDMRVMVGDIGKSELTRAADGRPVLRVDVPEIGEKPWSVLLHSPKSIKPVKKDELVVVSITVRVTGERTDSGLVGIWAEATEPGKGSVGGQVLPTTEVQTFRRSVVSPGDFPAGEFLVSVHLGGKQQTLEIFDVHMEAYPAGTSLEDLKIDQITWDGRELDAPWRADAAKRIDTIRKADLSVVVLDADGNPVTDAVVQVAQQEHEWRFGTFLGGKMLEDTPDGERYRQIVRERYNFVTLPAYLAEWGWLNDTNRRKYFELADWAQANNKRARGHLLVYPGWASSPGDWFTLPKPELRQRLEAHIPRAIAAFEPRGVTEWDVTNELRFNREFMEELGGLEVAAGWFKQAREALPDGTLYLNETVILPNNGATEVEQRTYEEQLNTLIAAGAEIDGIGMQGHFRAEMTPPTKVLQILDRFAAFDKSILITEYDMDNDDKQAQADYLRDFYTACFSHPSVEGIVMWGFWEEDMWQPRGHHFTKDWTETVLARSYHDLVRKQWWTDETAATDAAGKAVVRGYRGDYRVTVMRGDYSREVDVVLPKDGATLTVRVP